MKRLIIHRAMGCALLAFVIMGCKAGGKTAHLKKYHRTRLAMDTIVRVDICDEPGQDKQVFLMFERIWARIKDLEQKFNNYSPESEISRLNRSLDESFVPSADLYTVVAKAVELSKLTAGHFDVTVGPFIALWKEAQAKNILPDEGLLKEISGQVGYQFIGMDGANVWFEKTGVQIDLGGIAKGFIVDRVAQILREASFKDFYVDAGGDVFASGNNCRGEPWRIGVKNPEGGAAVIDVIRLSNQAATTSGDYERFYQIQGQKFSHIINPLTGYPQKGVVSATVIAPSAMIADALSTALCVMDPEQGIRLIETLGSDYACLIIQRKDPGQYEIFQSSSYANFKK